MTKHVREVMDAAEAAGLMLVRIDELPGHGADFTFVKRGGRAYVYFDKRGYVVRADGIHGFGRWQFRVSRHPWQPLTAAAVLRTLVDITLPLYAWTPSKR